CAQSRPSNSHQHARDQVHRAEDTHVVSHKLVVKSLAVVPSQYTHLVATGSAECDQGHIEGAVLLYFFVSYRGDTEAASLCGLEGVQSSGLKLHALVIAMIGAATIAGAYFRFNPAIPIFVILGFGIYMVGRIGAPRLPRGTHISFGATPGVYLHGR